MKRLRMYLIGRALRTPLGRRALGWVLRHGSRWPR